jgi:hypothetical protein
VLSGSAGLGEDVVSVDVVSVDVVSVEVGSLDDVSLDDVSVEVVSLDDVSGGDVSLDDVVSLRGGALSEPADVAQPDRAIAEIASTKAIHAFTYPPSVFQANLA